jgi:serine/threonine protein phosphatase 1
MIVAIGDIHGEITKLKALMRILISRGLVGGTVIFLGDYIDRGENSVAALDYLIFLKEKNPNFIFLAGNHEQMLLEAWEVHLNTTLDNFTLKMEIADHYLQDFRDKYGKVRLTPKQVEFLKSLKLSHRTGHMLFTHGGINRQGAIDTWACGIEGPLPKGISRLVRGHVIHPYVTILHDNIAVDTGAWQKDGFLSAVIWKANGYFDAPAVISVGEKPESVIKLTNAPEIKTRRIRIHGWQTGRIVGYQDLEETRRRYQIGHNPYSDHRLLDLLNFLASYHIYLLEEKILIDPIRRNPLKML